MKLYITPHRTKHKTKYKTKACNANKKPVDNDWTNTDTLNSPLITVDSIKNTMLKQTGANANTKNYDDYELISYANVTNNILAKYYISDFMSSDDLDFFVPYVREYYQLMIFVGAAMLDVTNIQLTTQNTLTTIEVENEYYGKLTVTYNNKTNVLQSASIEISNETTSLYFAYND